MRVLNVTAALGLALLATACGRKPAPETPTPAESPAAASTTPSTPASTTPAPVERGTDDSEAMRRLAERRRAALEEMIFFGYDRSDLTPEARSVLAAKAEVLRELPSVRLTIEGHADERGSDEYNLALGMRRANAARAALVNSGLDANRFEAVSLGEERPLAAGSTEEAWARNRRAEFRIGGDANLASGAR